jgi:DNA-directed RNA polymerase III subunit RPC6
MASLASSRAGTGEDTPKIEILKDALYEEMRQHGDQGRLYNQSDLMGLNVIPKNDLGLLLLVIQGLTADQLLVAVSDSRAGIAWRYRSREDAKKHVQSCHARLAPIPSLTSFLADIPPSPTPRRKWSSR